VLGGEPPEIGHLSPVLPYERLRERTAGVLAYTPIHNVVGCPAMSVPLHWSERGLPVGAHFAAERGRDRLLFELAYQLEEARPWRDQWPPYSIPRLALG
jgi:amidase